MNDVIVKPYHGIKLENSPVTVVAKIANKTPVDKPDMEPSMKNQRIQQGKSTKAINPTIIEYLPKNNSIVKITVLNMQVDDETLSQHSQQIDNGGGNSKGNKENAI